MARLRVERRETVALDASPEAALASCRSAFAELGWEILEAHEARLVGMEHPLRLRCIDWPAEVEVRVQASSPTGTTATLSGSAYGVGRGASRQLAAKLEAIRKRLAAGCA